MRDWVSLPRSKEPVEVASDLTLSPAEMFFQMWLLEAQGLLSFRVMHEGGMQTSFADVRTTGDGKRKLYLAAQDAPGQV